MNQKTLILSIPVILAVLLLGGWFLSREPQSAPESQKTPVAGENPPQNAGNLQSPANIDTSQPQNPVDTQPVPEIDISNWKTYRNEKLGFEFKLSDEYSIPENEKNTVGKKENVTLLDPKKTEYLFNSRKGLELVRDVAGRGDAVDVWRVRLKIYPYSSLFKTDFKTWIEGNTEISIEKIGTKILYNERSVNFVSWGSICSDYSAFFSYKNLIVEFNSCGSAFFFDDNEDYFSAILNSVRF